MRFARGALLVLVACRSAPQEIKPKDVAAISPASGEVSAKLVPDPNAPAVQLGPDEQFIGPRLRPDNPSPVYPSELIPLHLGPHVVSVRVTFDERGSAWKIDPSPIAPRDTDRLSTARLDSGPASKPIPVRVTFDARGFASEVDP